MGIVATVIFFVFLLVGVLIVPLTLPGTWLIFLSSLIYSYFRDFKMGDKKVLLVILVLAILGEVMEFWISLSGSKKEPIGKGPLIVSMIGGFVGAILGSPLFIIGPVIGLFLGTFLGALAYGLLTEQPQKAFRVATSIFTSRVVSVFAKTALAFGMALFIFLQI